MKEIETTILRHPIQDVRNLTDRSYQPNGYTALLDAIGQTLKRAVETYFLLPSDQTQDKVLVFTITDGQENASREYSRTQIANMIQQLQTNKA